jgi:hypothetical protein
MVLKAAEATKQTGNTHFIIISAADASSAVYTVTPGRAETSFNGNTASTTYASPSTALSYMKPGLDAYIRVLRLSPGAHAVPGAVSADEVVQFVGSRVQRG